MLPYPQELFPCTPHPTAVQEQLSFARLAAAHRLMHSVLTRSGAALTGEEMSVDVAMAAVRARRPGAQPNAGFMRQLVAYEAALRQDRGPPALAAVVPCLPQAIAAAGLPTEGLAVDPCSTALSRKKSAWVDDEPASPTCGAAFPASRCDSDGSASEADPAPSPQSSAGDCHSCQGTPGCSTSGPADWDVPIFSLINGFSSPPSSPERACA